MLHSETTSKTSALRPIGILAALPDEIAGLIERMTFSALPGESLDEGRASPLAGARIEQWGRRDFHIGRLHGRECVVALSRIGKVAAAATASAMIHRFDVSAMIFVGVAGGVASDVHVGDIVLADTLLQHDMNAAPLFPRFEVPLLERTRFDASADLVNGLEAAAKAFLSEWRGSSTSAALGARKTPRIHRGLIGSGDRFVSGSEEISALIEAIPDLLAVDMESAAVAQICYEHDIPLAVMRSISDGADEGAAMSFAEFLSNVAAVYADGVLTHFLSRYFDAEPSTKTV